MTHRFNILTNVFMGALLIAPAHILRADSIDDTRVQSALSQNGCVIDLSNQEFAAKFDLDQSEVDDFIGRSLDGGKATQQENWLFWSKDNCEILPPFVANDIDMDDLFAFETIIWPEESAVMGDIAACYIKVFEFVEALEPRYDYDTTAAHDAYARFLSASIISGDVAFYSDSPFSTPWGSQVIVGERCENAPNREAIQDNHKALIDNFDAYVRAVSEVTICGQDRIDYADLITISNEFIKTEKPNGFAGFEFELIVGGAGWYGPKLWFDDAKVQPPLCHFE